MGKKNKNESLGRALIKNRFSSRGKSNNSMLHTSELNDGYDWGRLNLQSVTEESSFDDFLRTAELAGTEFQAEKLNVRFVSSQTVPGVLTKQEREDFERIKSEKKDLLRIPRRPKWDSSTTGDELKGAERDGFLEWRRDLALLQDGDDIIMTPYEKNLDFWRQLWRVVERSDIVVQIVDARNPLLFRCEDLERYCIEVDSNKINFLLLNKADFLTARQRREWAKYFDSIGVRCAFYSAIKDLETLEEETEDTGQTDEEEEKLKTKDGEKTEIPLESETTGAESDGENSSEHDGVNSHRLLSSEELINLFENLLDESSPRINDDHITVGLVGYPNVGKSSTINSIMGSKRVSVSATPGKTKHFQTMYVEDTKVMLCDCPGLVFPSLVGSKADMLLFGILPIDQMRDFTQAVGTLCTLIPRHHLQRLYSIMIPQLETHPYIAFLSSYAYSRGFMTANGQPDMSRAARIILKDFVNGKILYCISPPGVDQESFHPFPQSEKTPPKLTPVASRAIADSKTISINDLDGNFFSKMNIGAHSKGSTMAGQVISQSDKPGSSVSFERTSAAKPWKDHSHKRNKKEKLRRLYRHLDQ